MTRPLALCAWTTANRQKPAGAEPPTSQHLAVAVHAVMHACKDVSQSGLAHPLLPYEHHPVVGVPRLRGDDWVRGVGGPAPAAVVLRGSRVMAALAVLVGLFLDHQMPAIRWDAPALLLWLHAHSALAHGDIIQSHCWVLESEVAKMLAVVSMSKSSGVSNIHSAINDILLNGVRSK